MQKAIRDFIEEESKKNIPLEVIDEIIDKIVKSEIKAARQKQLRLWRKSSKINLKRGIKP